MKIYRQALNKVKEYIPGKPIEEVKRQLRLRQVYKLASNENPYPPTYLRKIMLEALNQVNRYPQGDCFYLRKILGKKLGVDSKQIIFGNGSDDIIMMVLRTFVEEGDQIIIGYPTFLMYEVQAQVQGAQIIKVPLVNYQYNLDEMAAKVTEKTKIIFLANPNNPTGTYVNHNQVKDFLKKVPETVLVYFDEAYLDFAPSDFPDTKKFLLDKPNVIFTRTFSKAHGLAGLRIGYAVAREEVIKLVEKVRDPFNVNSFAQAAAQAALENKSFLKKVVSFVSQEKQYLYRELKKIGLNYVKSATNFVMVDFQKSAVPVYQYLLNKGIVIRELSGWGFPNYFRVTVGLHKENKKFIQYLKEFLRRK